MGCGGALSHISTPQNNAQRHALSAEGSVRLLPIEGGCTLFFQGEKILICATHVSPQVILFCLGCFFFRCYFFG